jgi:hypothetical protein
MRPAGGLAELLRAVGALLVEFLEAGIGVSLQNPFRLREMATRMLTLSIRGEVVDDARGAAPDHGL